MSGNVRRARPSTRRDLPPGTPLRFLRGRFLLARASLDNPPGAAHPCAPGAGTATRRPVGLGCHAGANILPLTRDLEPVVPTDEVMTHLTSILRISVSSLTRTFGRTGAASLCLAIAATAPGCLDEAPPSGDALQATADLATASVAPAAMWANSVWFVGNSGSVVGYSQVRFEYTNSGGARDFLVPIDSSGGFSKNLPSGGPFNGDVIRATWSGAGVGDVGCNFVFRYNGGAVFTLAEMGCVVTARAANVVLNEILANEAGSATAGEFIELVNLGNASANLGGWTLADGVATRHTFTAATTLAPGRALVVFGGASAIPAGLGNAVAASSGTLGLNNTGDVVTLRTADGATRAVVDYGSELSASDGVSMNLSPEGTASGQYVLHSSLSAAPASPGARTSGASW
jgi:lamin tail-like protein